MKTQIDMFERQDTCDPPVKENKTLEENFRPGDHRGRVRRALRRYFRNQNRRRAGKEQENGRTS